MAGPSWPCTSSCSGRATCESPGFSGFAVDDWAVYLTYTTTARGVEFLMSYYAILDRMPKGSDEGSEWQTWLRSHDVYKIE